MKGDRNHLSAMKSKEDEAMLAMEKEMKESSDKVDNEIEN